jgi:hypothetical protein
MRSSLSPHYKGANMDELEAMKAVADVLEPLDPPARNRVLHWANAKYAVPSELRQGGASAPADVPAVPAAEFSEFADLFYAVEPQSIAERALVAAYWLAGPAGEPFQSQALNGLLKDLGYQAANITDALSQNMRERPALIVQIKKSGSTRQARKSYKITDAGMRKVRSMIQDRGPNGDGNG